jgi:bifunctional non-homologous end joining protein LigD
LLGALLLGAHDPASGDRCLVELEHLLAPLSQRGSPFANAVPRDRACGAHWVRPELVGEVVYRQFTGEGRLRHAAWRGLRPDRAPDASIVIPDRA